MPYTSHIDIELINKILLTYKLRIPIMINNNNNNNKGVDWQNRWLIISNMEIKRTNHRPYERKFAWKKC